ncbi:hypothetical protein [Paenibacillus qinlingensis]|uniref:Copper amine oxidase-like N-terminal domain-containing protein n=1 Tax=Paenibacillus qinlingensis TaxID=1837343 RepID=A0ABU1NQ54_9BACL|nr:hypothetical protein [Paenibacillus qinlingensis]MDR6549137.1 hypothetical protein [Paenibacillus qinlingensis]
MSKRLLCLLALCLFMLSFGTAAYAESSIEVKHGSIILDSPMVTGEIDHNDTSSVILTKDGITMIPTFVLNKLQSQSLETPLLFTEKITLSVCGISEMRLNIRCKLVRTR